MQRPDSVLSAKELSAQLFELGDENIAQHSQRFFKTGDGEYGAGDKFLGIRVPVLRQQAKKSIGLSNSEVITLLKSPWHEVRLCALLVWVYQFPKSDVAAQRKIAALYLKNSRYVNNWDLVDSSAHKILGPLLFNSDRDVLHQLVKSQDLWERRIAIITTYYFIQQNDFADTMRLCAELLKDKEDLIHKASGWMLREVGKRDKETTVGFLDQYAAVMPRTMLRYSLEKFSKEEQRLYMNMA